jgi:hypothetical protein
VLFLEREQHFDSTLPNNCTIVVRTGAEVAISKRSNFARLPQRENACGFFPIQEIANLDSSVALKSGALAFRASLVSRHATWQGSSP